MKTLFILILSLSFFGCKKADETTIVEKTGIELVAIGSLPFGGVLVGDYKEATVRITNYGPDEIKNFNPVLVLPFSVQNISSPCNTGKIPVLATCYVKIRFSPTSLGIVNDSLIVGDKSQVISGKGLTSAGSLSYSISSWNLGEVVAGAVNVQEITITNDSDFVVEAPTTNTISGISRTYNECGTYIYSKRSCVMRFSIIKQTTGIAADTLTFSSPNVSSFDVSINSIVKPGPPSGTIGFNNPPTSIIANGGIDTKTIQTFPIRDEFGNIVADGTEVSILANNANATTPTTRPTSGGLTSFPISSTTQRGDVTITVISGAATGFLRFPSLAGPGTGDITAKPYIGTVQANGLSQITINLNAIRDQFNNVIEDGSLVNFYLRPLGTNCFNFSLNSSTPALGSLFNSTANTVLGESQVSIISSTQIGSSVVVAKSGEACGYWTVNFISGEGYGSIPVISQYNGIYADPSSGISANPPEIIQSTITIGPVLDINNNPLAQGSTVDISLTNAIGVDSGTSSFSIALDSQAKASFVIQGTGNRGNINISASKNDATGSLDIWAYGDSVLRPVNPNASNNIFKITMTYKNTTPSIDDTWGSVNHWNNLDLQDKSYFGDLKKRGQPTLVADNLPYFVNHCFFSSGNTVYGSNCLKDNYNDSSVYHTLTISKGNKPLDPGASLISTNVNFPRAETHQINQIGCYKQDTQVGSLTYGEEIFFKDAIMDVCNSLTSNDSASIVYRNDTNPWFGGTWRTDKIYDLRFSATGFVPDFGKTILFGGLYESYLYGNGLNEVTANKTFLSNLMTWSANFGISAPFNWEEPNNADNLYGDFPDSRILPELTNSNDKLFMFGGLRLFGKSQSVSGPVLDYTSGSSLFDDLFMYDGTLNKWKELFPGGDNLITNQNETQSPIGRYQHGMVYIPETNSLFVASGKSKIPTSTTQWFEPNDLWSIDNVTADSISWKRRCFPCNFPANAHYQPSQTTPSTLNPTPLKMAYHPYYRKVFMLWSATNYNIYSFDPLMGNDTISVSSSTPYDFSSIQDNKLFDMTVNPDTGRTYFYKRFNQGNFDSSLYYWDMNSDEMQYLKIEANIGVPAKTFARKLEFHIRGYGSVKDSNISLQGSGGIIAYAYNYSTNQWTILGSNTASLESQDISSQEIIGTINQNQVSNYISNEGKISVMISPNNSSNFVGDGYNELRIDEFYIKGLF